MSGIYIHIPFCASRCIYCGFYSTTNLELRQKYVDAVCKEMTMREVSSPIETIYFGGGTPSQLTPEQLRQLFLYINKVYAPHATEVTIEMYPDDVTPEYAETLSQLGVNRVSMGAQTFNDERLRFLRRRHSSSQVYDAVRILREAGICNISIDLMYGFPDETLDDFRRDIDAALALDVEHISAYCLMIEEGTALHRMGVRLVMSTMKSVILRGQAIARDITPAIGTTHPTSALAPLHTRMTDIAGVGMWLTSVPISLPSSAANFPLSVKNLTLTLNTTTASPPPSALVTDLISESWTSVTVSTVSLRHSDSLLTAYSKSLTITFALHAVAFSSAIW